MMRILTTGAAALALIATPTLAAAAPSRAAGLPAGARASALSLSPAQRAGTSGQRTTKLTQQGGIIAAVLALGVIAGGVILIADNDDDPDSP